MLSHARTSVERNQEHVCVVCVCVVCVCVVCVCVVCVCVVCVCGVCVCGVCAVILLYFVSVQGLVLSQD